ncbi:MAG: response regulator [Candidatus Hydrothermota bacterium]|nr:MAG: response regulator [Candidatus Hydrothermae bacterium]
MGERKYKILFVDDDPNIRLLYKTVFSKEGYEVMLAESGEDARKMVQENDDIDLIVLDIKMKGESGLKTLQHLVKEKGNIPVILCTAYSAYQDDFTSWLADAYVVKSPDLQDLKREIQRLLKRKRA